MKQLLILFSILPFLLPDFAKAQMLILGQQTRYIYNNSKDTILLSNLNAGFFPSCDSLQIVDSIQIDGQGSKEIVFYRHCKWEIEDHGGSFEITEKKEIGKYEIWNVDTKEMLFEAINYRKASFNRFDLRKNPSHLKGNEFYEYTLAINSAGTVTIKNLKTKVEATTLKEKQRKKNRESKFKKVPYYYSIKSDKEEGIYKFINGKYIRE